MGPSCGIGPRGVPSLTQTISFSLRKKQRCLRRAGDKTARRKGGRPPWTPALRSQRRADGCTHPTSLLYSSRGKVLAHCGCGRTRRGTAPGAGRTRSGHAAVIAMTIITTAPKVRVSGWWSVHIIPIPATTLPAGGYRERKPRPHRGGVRAQLRRAETPTAGKLG